MKIASALSFPVSRLLEVMSKGAGKTSTLNIDLLRETLEAIGWSVSVGVGLYRLDDYERVRKTEFGQWLKAHKEIELWGYNGVKEPKHFWFSGIDGEENALDTYRNFPVPTGTPPSTPKIGQVYIQSVSKPFYDSPRGGIWTIVTEGWSIGLPSYTFTNTKGATATVIPPIDSYGFPDPAKLQMASFWTWAYKNGLQEDAQKALSEAVVAPKPLAPGDRTLDNTGHCAACLANVKLSQERIMRHGWSVQGDRGRGQYGNSWHTGPCVGAGYLPWEISPKGAEVYLGQLAAYQTQLERKIQVLRGEPQEIPNPRYLGYNQKAKTLTKGDLGYEDGLKLLIAQQTQELVYLNNDINELKTRIAAWVPKALYGKVATRWLVSQTLKNAASERDELDWAAEQLSTANDLLESAKLVLTARGSGHGEGSESIADGNPKIDRAVDEIQKISGALARVQHALQAEASRPSHFASKPGMLDNTTKRHINQQFKAQGLDENKGFETATQGYSKSWEVLAEFGLHVSAVVDSHLFVDRSTEDGKADDGSVFLRMAFKDPHDTFNEVPVKNSLLAFSFHRKETGQFGCHVYVS